MSDLGERVSALHASFEAFERYEHDRWHKLNNDLQPFMRLPERLARDIGELSGSFNGQLSALRGELDRSVAKAVTEAIEPLESRLQKLEAKSNRLTGAQQLIVFLIQTLIAATVAVIGVLSFGRVK